MNAIAKPSIQSLFIEMQFDGQSLSTGTAFVVNTPTKGPHLVTNRHNVTGRNQETGKPLSKTGGVPNNLVIFHNKLGNIGHWVMRQEPLYKHDESPRWIEHPTLEHQADFVALPLTNLHDVELYPYDPKNQGPNIRIGPADTISVIGFPFGVTAGGFFGVWATGFLASEPVVNFSNLPIQLIDCRSREGQSGSPVIAYRSGGSVAMADGGTAIFGGPVERFIGIYSGRINKESDLGIVWKASAIDELVQTL
jgi:hypothetical protein